MSSLHFESLSVFTPFDQCSTLIFVILLFSNFLFFLCFRNRIIQCSSVWLMSMKMTIRLRRFRQRNGWGDGLIINWNGRERICKFEDSESSLLTVLCWATFYTLSLDERKRESNASMSNWRWNRRAMPDPDIYSKYFRIRYFSFGNAKNRKISSFWLSLLEMVRCLEMLRF